MSRRLVGGVGDEAAADLLGGLEPVGELVELPGQLAELIAAPDVHPVAVLALPDDADGPEQVGDAPGEHLGKDHAHDEHHHADDQGDGAQVPLDVGEEPGLVGVPLIEVDAADGHVPVDDGDGGPAVEGAVQVGGGGHVIALEGGGDLAEHGVAPLGEAELVAVVEDEAELVGDQHPELPGVAQGLHVVPDGLAGEGLGAGDGVGDDRGLGLEEAGLGPEDQVLGDQHRVGVEQYEHRRDDDDVGEGEFELDGAAEGDLLRPGHRGHGLHLLAFSCFSGSSPRPIW